MSNLQKSACFALWVPEALHRLEEFNASNNLMKESISFLHFACVYSEMPICHDLAWL